MTLNYCLASADLNNYFVNLDDKVVLLSLLFAAVISIGFFILKAVAICRMAKKKGYKNWWLGMIPYANYILLGKLAGPIRIFRMDISNMGIFVIIGSVILDVINLAYYFGNIITEIIPIAGYAITLLYSFSYIIELVYFIAFFSLVYAIFGKYVPQKRMLFSALSLIQPVFAILLIVIMDKKPYDSIDDYYRELMAKRYGQTYNPHVNPYQTYENPFSDYSNSEKAKTKIEDPFEEYKD